MEIVETIKQHPLPVIGGIGFLAILMVLGKSSNNGVDPGISASLQSQSIASSTNLGISGINADVQKTALTDATARYYYF